MRRDVLDLRAFYAAPLGRVAREMLGRKVAEAWGDANGLDVLGLGYATPFLDECRAKARRVVAAMPATQGVEVWPVGERNQAALVEETALPFPNAMFDRILAVHALEEADDPSAVLRELWRVMAPSGRLIVAVASRDGVWARAEGTPFGHGRPFSRSQLENLLREADLEPAGWTRALYAPPAGFTVGWAEGFEQVGARLWPRFAGLILMEAVKQTFAVKPRGTRARARVFAPVMPPVPAGVAPVRKAPGTVRTGILLEAVAPGPSLESPTKP
ncbi:class I SAM-dependent methyltransferase [Caulobacter endophyticus]|uniref:class I SAM-dependent methyltransferase n=1 Tax=Caulobacter endophyticus TaxID=2172652 RepID=UPI002410AE79|nr:methyltransferase domain-containing protein [Caulobacter endophyticus]MDG2528364.1 methyltransferase domain-containing protein [Caulobacter endophyticus]